MEMPLRGDVKANDSRFGDAPHGSLTFQASRWWALDLPDITCWHTMLEKCRSCKPYG